MSLALTAPTMPHMGFAFGVQIGEGVANARSGSMVYVLKIDYKINEKFHVKQIIFINFIIQISIIENFTYGTQRCLRHPT